MLRILGRLWGGGRPTVAMLRLTGPIGVPGRFRHGLSLAGIAPQIEAAFAMANLKAVALLINSPGGSPVQAALITQRIRDLAREKDVPVLAFTEDVAGSGGYMLALAGDEIFAHEASLIGSIGVVSGGFGFAAALDRFGVERRLHTAGESKARLDPFSPEKPEDVAWLLGLQAEIHDWFKTMVRERRGRRLKVDTPGLFSGDVWLARKALEFGLIDGIGDARNVLRSRFGKKIRLRLAGRRRGSLAGLLTPGASESGDTGLADLPASWLAAIETRLMWGRFGL